MQLPSIDFGGIGEELLFLHANGYPPECYRPLLSRLAENYHVTTMVQRPLWQESDPADIRDWIPLTDDLLRYLDAHHSGPLACIGHSMGGIALLRAALREPDRFKAIVLLDPVLFPPYFIIFWWMLYKSGLGLHIHPLVVNASQRRRKFDDLDRLFSSYRQKPVFRYMDDESLRACIEGIVCPDDEGGYKLCYSVEWEIRIYLTSIWRDMEIWRNLPKLEVPTLIVRGAETNTFWEKTGGLVQRRQPKVRIEALDQATHLVPLECPQKVSELIQSFIQENL